MIANNRDDKYLDKLIAQKFSASFMNNVKWVKLISLTVANTSGFRKCLVKLIWEEQENLRELLFDEDTEFDFNYYNSAMEAMVSGEPAGWYAYKEIEWLDFPGVIKDSTGSIMTKQDLQQIQNLLATIGEFETEITADKLRIYCYRRKVTPNFS